MTTEDTQAAAKPEPERGGVKSEAIDRSSVEWTLAYLAADYLARASALWLGFIGDYAAIVGAGLSFVLIGSVLYVYTPLRRSIGLTWTQTPGSIAFSISLILFLGAVGAYFGLATEPESRSAAKILHIVVLSPVSEEIAYRGIALAVLSRAFASRGMLWPLLISSVVFSLIHVPFREGGSSTDFLRFAYGTAMGMILGLVRIKSGSLCFPMIGHIAVNAAITLGLLLRR